MAQLTIYNPSCLSSELFKKENNFPQIVNIFLCPPQTHPTFNNQMPLYLVQCGILVEKLYYVLQRQ